VLGSGAHAKRCSHPSRPFPRDRGLYTFRELDALLRDAGFAAVDAYDQATGEPFAVGAGMRRVTVVARKE
jgi:hypothetical protein